MNIRTSFLLLPLIFLLFLSCKDKGNESTAHLLKGNDLVFNDDYEGAIKEYELAIKIDSNNWKACYSIACSFELIGDFKSALYYYNRTITINPNFAMGYYNRSNLEDLIGDMKSSAKDLNRSIELKNKLYMALLTRGQKEYSMGKMKDAVKDFSDAIDTRPDFYLIYSMRGACRLKSGDVDGAIRDFELEVKQKPDHMLGYANLAVAYATKKEYRPAINYINMALGMDPTWSQGYIYRGMYEYNLNVKDSACGDFRMAYKLHNPEAESYSKQYCK